MKKKTTNEKASISLAVMLVGFAATLFGKGNGATLLQNGFEAGLVGGLADWFAVSALFRHPLGIPIPHTALLPKNRERITSALVSIVENDLLNKSSVIDKVSKISFAQKILEIGQSKVYSDEVKAVIKSIAEKITDSETTVEVSKYLNQEAKSYLGKVDTKELLEIIISASMEQGSEEKLLNFLIDKLEEVIKKEEVKREIAVAVLNSIKSTQKGGMMQFTLSAFTGLIGEEKIADSIQDAVNSILNDARKEGNSSRTMAIDFIREGAIQLPNDENIISAINQYREEFINKDEFSNFFDNLLKNIEASIISYVNDEEKMEDTILPFIEKQITKMSSDTELVNKMDQYIREQISNYIEVNHEKIGILVKENIEKLDTENLVNLIEDKVGSDLQWIRVNGAICGFLIGLILGAIKLFVR